MKTLKSLQHPLVKHLVKLRTDRAYRYENQAVVVLGKKMVDEAVAPINILSLKGEGIQITPEILKKISGVSNPEGILAEVPMSPQRSLKKKKSVIVLDRIADPGNLGTLLRSALALGWEGAFILDGCCDPWNDKAIRAAKGATFRLPFQMGNIDELKCLVKDNAFEPLAADLKGTPLEEITVRKPLLVLGSEAHGLSEPVKVFCKKVTIPLSGKMESLNVSVAGGIMMYQLLN